MTLPPVVIWWLAPEDFEAIEQHSLPAFLPQWLHRQVRSARGRNGRGRLWCAEELIAAAARGIEWPGGALQARVDRCCGIVVPLDLVPSLLNLPGLITSFEIRRLDATMVFAMRGRGPV